MERLTVFENSKGAMLKISVTDWGAFCAFYERSVLQGGKFFRTIEENCYRLSARLQDMNSTGVTVQVCLHAEIFTISMFSSIVCKLLLFSAN